MLRQAFQGVDNDLFKKQTNQNEEVETEVKKVLTKIKIPRLLPDSEYENNESETDYPFYTDLVGCFEKGKN